MATYPFWIIFAWAVAFMSCAGPQKVPADVSQASHIWDKKVTFSAYKTFAWVGGDLQRIYDADIKDAAFDAQLRNAVMRELADKAILRPIGAKEDAHLLVAYHVTTRERRYDEFSPLGWAPANTMTMVRLGQSTVLLDFIDAATEKLVWRGTVRAQWNREDLKTKATEAQAKALIEQAVKAILAGYPPAN